MLLVLAEGKAALRDGKTSAGQRMDCANELAEGIDCANELAEAHLVLDATTKIREPEQ